MVKGMRRVGGFFNWRGDEGVGKLVDDVLLFYFLLSSCLLFHSLVL